MSVGLYACMHACLHVRRTNTPTFMHVCMSAGVCLTVWLFGNIET